MSDRDAAKYADWATELEKRRNALRGDRRRLIWLLPLAVLTAPIGLHWSGLVALWIFCVWTSAWAIGTYIAVMYDWDYARQLEAARKEIANLGQHGPPPADKPDIWASKRARHPGQVRFRS